MKRWWKGGLIRNKEFYKSIKLLLDFKILVFVSEVRITLDMMSRLSDRLKENNVYANCINLYTGNIEDFRKNHNLQVYDKSKEINYPYMLMAADDFMQTRKKPIHKTKWYHLIQNFSSFMNNASVIENFTYYLSENSVSNVLFIVSGNTSAYNADYFANTFKQLNKTVVNVTDNLEKTSNDLKRHLKRLISKKTNVLIIIEKEEYIQKLEQIYSEVLKLQDYYLRSYYNDLFFGEKPQIMIENPKMRRKNERDKFRSFTDLERHYLIYNKNNPEKKAQLEELLIKILDNILSDEFKQKFRRLKTSAPKLNELLFSDKRGVSLLKDIGFVKKESVDGVDTYTNDWDYKRIKETREKMIELFNKFPNLSSSQRSSK